MTIDIDKALKLGEYLTREENRLALILLEKSDSVVSRDEIAEAVWKKRWLEKYSDWQIDRLIYLVRKKLSPDFEIKTLRNSGYALVKKGVPIPKALKSYVEGTSPTDFYLEFMNNPKNERRVLKHLFRTCDKEGVSPLIGKKIDLVLVINSFSFDNIDAINKWMKRQDCNPEVYFTNFDDRALKMHQKRIDELKLHRFKTIYDEIRNTRLRENLFDLVINDFRLNFNDSHQQNLRAVTKMYEITKTDGYCLISVVVDARYESIRFGIDQARAPINKDRPGWFESIEQLKRKCFTVPYYKKLFTQAGYQLIKEFDVETGKSWASRFRDNPTRGLSYRRFLLRKI